MELRPIMLVAVPGGAEVRLRAALPEASFEPLADAGAARKHAREAPGDLAVVWMRDDVEGEFRAVRDLVAAGARVVLVGPEKDADLILRALREGASEFVVASDEEALAHALRAQLRPPRAAEAGEVICVFAAKGGAGATTIATNLAAALQRHSRRTLLVDLDLNLGDVLAFLDLGGGYSLSDVVANMRRLDRNLLEASMLRHPSGVHVLAQSHRVEEADAIDAASLASLFQFLRQFYDAIVVDGLRTFDDLALTTFDAASTILLVVTQEVPAVRNARRCAELFRRLGRERSLKLVVNRFQKTAEISAEVVAETVGLPVAATIANDYPAVLRSVNKGVLLTEGAPRAQVTRELDALVPLLGAPAPAPAPERRSILRRFFSPRVSHAIE